MQSSKMQVVQKLGAGEPRSSPGDSEWWRLALRVAQAEFRRAFWGLGGGRMRKSSYMYDFVRAHPKLD